LMSESLMDHSIPEIAETSHRKISEIWNNHNKLHCEKIKLSYQLQSTQTALNRTVAASRKLPLFTKSDIMKLETPVRETKFLRRTSSTSRCYVKKRSYSFEKFLMSSSFSEVGKWQRWRICAVPIVWLLIYWTIKWIFYYTIHSFSFYHLKKSQSLCWMVSVSFPKTSWNVPRCIEYLKSLSL
jgi:hypothetical protein